MKTQKIILRAILFLFILWVLSGFDHRLEVTRYEYANAKIPSDFDGFRVVQISDFHLKKFGKNEAGLIQAVRNCSPDLILLTGDVVDENHSDIAPLRELLAGISDLAPIYFVSGNHDLYKDTARLYGEMLSLFEEYAVINLDDAAREITRGGSSIFLTGSRWRSKYVTDYLSPADTRNFNILLYHGSDYFPQLSTYGYDLIFSGHAHGGIVRLPFVGGVFANDGSLFPKYCSGYHTLHGSTLISSRGLGDAFIPRFYNRPELVCVTLCSSS